LLKGNSDYDKNQCLKELRANKDKRNKADKTLNKLNQAMMGKELEGINGLIKNNQKIVKEEEEKIDK